MGRLSKICAKKFHVDLDCTVFTWHTLAERIVGENADGGDMELELSETQRRLRICYLNTDIGNCAMSSQFGTVSESHLGSRAYANELNFRTRKLTKELLETFASMVRDIIYRHIEDCTPIAERHSNTRSDLEEWKACSNGTLQRIQDLLEGSAVRSRALGVLILGGDTESRGFVEEHWGRGVVERIDTLAAALADELNRPLDVVITEAYSAVAERMVADTVQVRRHTPPFMERLGLWSQRLSTGIPIFFSITIVLKFLFSGCSVSLSYSLADTVIVYRD